MPLSVFSSRDLPTRLKRIRRSLTTVPPKNQGLGFKIQALVYWVQSFPHTIPRTHAKKDGMRSLGRDFDYIFNEQSLLAAHG
jgi:hypothetical protein